ncbi:MAG: aminotransferase class I/II-fold pyridoxal phosphate-dependent enzyme [Clostridia bacterium]|nr:aminotransferase class I/II-fold pyridoxal phosphate-dependent enzyme [Clostridia bacterium]
MISFMSDYTKGACPQILQKLIAINDEHMAGYSMDVYCASAKEKIQVACQKENADVFFLSGGTQTNQNVISALLDSYEGVICASSGHINVHEAGAIELTGHKVLSLPSHGGKLCAEETEKYLSDFHADENRDHAVYPGMVYISHPTEYGTLYTKKELSALYAVCRTYNIPLYIDGARLGYGLSADGTDLSLPEIADLCDAFYIGGTKVGALLGEAVVFPKGNAPKHFFTRIKQHGALLAKSWILGVQFDTLFTDDLYFKIARHAVLMANKMREGFFQKGYAFLVETTANQIFVVLENEKMKALQKEVAFELWEKVDENHSAVRFCTSWATKEEEVESLLALL